MKKMEPDVVHIGACLLKSRAFSVPVTVKLTDGERIYGVVETVDRSSAVFYMNGRRLKLWEMTGVEEG